jgi:RNA polymerase sigma-70 factor (ECF subfamily)
VPVHDADFDAFYRATYPSLLAQVYVLTNDWAEAQDCLQEAYARCWQRWAAVRGMDVPAG